MMNLLLYKIVDTKPETDAEYDELVEMLNGVSLPYGTYPALHFIKKANKGILKSEGYTYWRGGYTAILKQGERFIKQTGFFLIGKDGLAYLAS